MAMSVGAFEALSEAYGSLPEALAAMSPGEGETIFSPGVIAGTLAVASVLLEWGAKHRKVMEGADVEAPTLDWLKTVMDQKDYTVLYGAVISAITRGNERLIETEDDPKNAVAAQG